ncbi:MAG: N-acetylmuramoyl-L-alanine amidase-like domain-containing protein [Patescibacteria group bacterium]
MNKKDLVIAILILVLLFVLGYSFISNVEPEVEDPDQEEVINGEDTENGDEEEGEDSEEEEVEKPELKELVLGYLGEDYEADPLDDDENVYNDDEFNSTTLVLVTAANYHFPEDPEEGIKQIHYEPAGEVSYENRLHFTTYRNQVSEFFSDITEEVGGDLVESKEITLNKDTEEDGRLIDIDWEEEITLNYINVDDVIDVIPELPEVAGVTFIKEVDEEIGLDVRREGLLVDGDRFIHASSEEEEVVEENLLDFLEDNDYDAVNFFEINE